MIESIEHALKTVNLAAVIDHSGRGGNAFFLTTFDNHPQVLACPLMHYTYSYIQSEFPGQKQVDVEKAKSFLTEKSYFRLLYHAANPMNQALIYRMGAENIEIPQEKIQTITDQFLKHRQQVSRKELVLLPFLIYASALGKNLLAFKYVLVSDAVSLRTESVAKGFSGLVIDNMVEDFPHAKLMSLVRDPRATFASPRHQFVNQLGNMYAVTPKNVFLRFFQLLFSKFAPDTTCVYLYWLLYLAQSARTIENKKSDYSENFMTVRNEDLNLHFLKTVQWICKELEVSLTKDWEEGNYTPTILGKPWMGTGAYNSRYQQNTKGILENDSQDVSKKSAGPNQYVTQRWQSKLNQREIALIEFLFQNEMNQFDYKPLKTPSKYAWVIILKNIVLPFEGEMPTFRWLKNGFKNGFNEAFNRLFYLFVFPPFYMVSRIRLIQFIYKQAFFDFSNKTRMRSVQTTGMADV